MPVTSAVSGTRPKILAILRAILGVDPVRESSIHDGHTSRLYAAALKN